MKKVWIIRNGQHMTAHSHENKAELKKIRDQLNKDSGFSIPAKGSLTDTEYTAMLATNLQTMPYKITKGPDHPRA